MYDVFLGGTQGDWYGDFQENISKDISIFCCSENKQKSLGHQISEELHAVDHCKVAVFYFVNVLDTIPLSQIAHMGNATGKDTPVIVGFATHSGSEGKQDIKAFCELCGIPIVYGLENLIWSVEEYLSQLAVCECLDGYNSNNGQAKSTNNGRLSNNIVHNRCGIHASESLLSRI